MSQEKIYLRGQDVQRSLGFEKQRKNVFRTISKIVLMSFLIATAWKAYDVFWLRHSYLITAYCGCPICINKPEFRDGKFASQRPVYWGGIAADKSVPFGSRVELVPLTILDFFAVGSILDGRRDFTVEDRGGKIHGRHLDIYIPDSRGGHQTALRWGARRMRVKINGRLVD